MNELTPEQEELIRQDYRNDLIERTKLVAERCNQLCAQHGLTIKDVAYHVIRSNY